MEAFSDMLSLPFSNTMLTNYSSADTVTSADMPARLQTYTPEENKSSSDSLRQQSLKALQPLLAQNAANQEPFCTDPDSVVTLTVDPKNHSQLYRRQYPFAATLHEAVSNIIARWLQQGRITRAPTNCRFNSPLLPVPKKDDNGRMTGVRLCIDVRQLNRFLQEEDKFQIPYIPSILQSFAGNRLFGEFDLSDAYNQFSIATESRPYTAFTWDKQQYMCIGCPFGIKHLPSLFQRFMCRLFADMPFVFPYLDNIAFASSSWEEHEKHAKLIIDRLNSVNLKVKPASVNIGNSHMKLLGHVLSANGIEIDPEKKQMIMNWDKPKEGSVLQSALGLGAYLHDHIRHYADITAPLEAVKKQKIIQWNDTLDRHWLLFKRAFATAPILRFPDFNKRFVLATDASQTGVGGVLYQPDDDNDSITSSNIVAICSKKLDTSQRNYPVYKKELFGVVYSLRKFHTYIWGRTDVTVLTDHKPLIHILKQKQMAVALQQWLDVLLNYDLTIKYRPGILHVAPDALSRMYTMAYQDEDVAWGTLSNIRFIDAHATSLSPSDMLCEQSISDIQQSRKSSSSNSISSLQITVTGDSRTVSSHMDTLTLDTSIASINELTDDQFDLWQDATHVLYQTANLNLSLTPSFLDIDNEDTTNICPISEEDKLRIAQEKRGCTIPPVDQRQTILDDAHEHGHYGQSAMYARITRDRLWWPSLKNDIKDTVNACDQCCKYNTAKSGYHPARPVQATLPGDHYQIDLASMPKSIDGKTFMLLCVDVFTGFVMVRALPDKTARSVATALFDIFSTIGIPRILQSDNGSEFQNDVIQALTSQLGINHRFIAGYNPRANGKVERIVRTIKVTMMKLLRGANVFWPLHVPYVQYAYNDKVHAITGSTPFSLMFGRSPNKPINYNNGDDLRHFDTTIDDIDAWKEHQTRVISLIFPAINQRVSQKQKQYIEKLNAARAILTDSSLRPGTRVMLKDPAYMMDDSIKPSHEPTYIGPYIVIRRLSHGPYLVKDETGATLDRVVPLDQMKLVETSSPAVSSDNRQVFVVERIIAHRITPTGALQYRVKWKGCGHNDNSWINDTDLVDTDIVHQYFKTGRHAKLQAAIEANTTADILSLQFNL